MTLARIDTHHHAVPQWYRDLLAERGIASAGKPIPDWTPEMSLHAMDRSETELAVLSVAPPAAEFLPVAESPRLSRRLNEELAEIARSGGGRFGFFASASLRDVDGATEELVFALDRLGAQGVTLLSHYGGHYLGAPVFEPIMRELDQRHAVIFVHPAELPGPGADGIPGYAVDFLLETARVAINVARNGVFERYPNVNVILSHAGGFVPYAAQRLATFAGEGDEEVGLARLRRFWFDLALSGSRFALPSLLAFADPTRIVFGSDYPLAPLERGEAFTGRLDAYADIDHDAINRANALRLFAGEEGQDGS